jgi:hypothetical protein
MAAAGALSLAVAIGCQSRVQEQSGVKLVEAKIDGLTCETCVPPLTASLRSHFDKADVKVDDEQDTATVKFDTAQDFSETAFRDAATQVRMRVVSYRLQACGRIEAKDSERWLVAGSNRFLVRSSQDIPVGQPLCLDGTLTTGSGPSTLEVATFERQGVVP